MSETDMTRKELRDAYRRVRDERRRRAREGNAPAVGALDRFLAELEKHMPPEPETHELPQWLLRQLSSGSDK